jgi:hypothetical protein
MTYLLFFLFVGFLTTLVLMTKQLRQRQRQKVLRITLQQLDEANRHLQRTGQRYSESTSTEGSIAVPDIQIAALTKRSEVEE